MTTRELIDGRLVEIAQALDIFNYNTPINGKSEQKKFFNRLKAGQVYNVRFRYKKKPAILADIQKELIEMRKKTQDSLLLEMITGLLLRLEYLNTIGDDLAKPMFLYGTPKKETLAIAERYLLTRKKDPILKQKISAQEAKDLFLEALQKYKIKDWKVKLSKSILANANTAAENKTIYLKNRRFLVSQINKLVVHEIETHVLRACNGSQQKYKILGTVGMPGYLETEEGLAILNEYMTGNLRPNIYRFICARAVATHLSQHMSFYDLFKTMCDKFGFSQKNAYILTKRAKRGMTDTSKPGGFVKDHVYLEGFLKLQKFVKNGGDIRSLYAGKIALEHTHLVDRGILKQPTILPSFVDAVYGLVITKQEYSFGSNIMQEKLTAYCTVRTR